MITKLVIGPHQGSADEVWRQFDAHPHAIREWVELVRTTSGQSPRTVCTYSPMVIHAVIAAWDKDPLMYSWIVLRSDDGRDTPLLDKFNPEWLAHFAIEDLYMHGEFDTFLKVQP